jgi:hypothetical protein
MEDALKKLDKSTQEEARMVVAHNLKATHTVDGRVRRVAITVEAINNTVARVDDRVVQVDDRVARVYDRSKHSHQTYGQRCRSRETFVITNLITADYRALHIILEDQLRKNIHEWLSPPDPSVNHKEACRTDRKKAATWFVEGSIFQEWKSTASLLWIDGIRAFCPISHPIPSDDIFDSSWLRKEYSLVSACLTPSIIRD